MNHQQTGGYGPTYRPSLRTVNQALSILCRLIRFHREAALRTHSFSPGTGQLFKLSAQQCEQQHRQLRFLALAMFGTLRDRESHEPQKAASNHVVLNWDDASSLVRKAARLERRISRFCERSVEAEQYQQLRFLYDSFAEAGRSRAHRFEKAISSPRQSAHEGAVVPRPRVETVPQVHATAIAGDQAPDSGFDRR